ncbi:MAG: winged helix-turn-helix domain-containing protein [Candidatus Bathyarchaeia archaeon]
MFCINPPQTSALRMFRYRDRIAIMSDILREAKKTQIMELARLNYVQTKKYLSYLVSYGYLAITERETYIITEKGARFLQMIEIQKIQTIR